MGALGWFWAHADGDWILELDSIPCFEGPAWYTVCWIGVKVLVNSCLVASFAYSALLLVHMCVEPRLVIL